MCIDVRAHPDRYASDAAVAAFTEAQGYHPAQCTISSGQPTQGTRILETWFQGNKVYAAATAPPR